MGLDLASFGAGFFGQAVKDREANKEEERLARRQAMLNKLQEESAIRTAQRKTTAGTPYKVGDKYYVQDTDGEGNVKGPAREARPDEIRAYEVGDAEYAGKKARADVDVKQAKYWDEDRSLDIESKRLQQESTRQSIAASRANVAQGWAQESRMSSQDKEAKAAAKREANRTDKEQQGAVAAARNAMNVLATLPKTQEVVQLYKEIDATMLAKKPGYVSRIRMLEAQIKALADKGSNASQKPIGLDPNL